jgi:RNA polymerase sigma-70 factor, ECF subfamily
MDETRNELEALYRERYAQFIAMAMTLVGGDVAEANDVAQEAFARAYANAEGFRGDGPLAGWVWRILLNHASRVRAARHELLPIDYEVPADLPNPGGDPELHVALQALSSRQRTIVFLRFYAGLSYEEIATAVNVQSGTVAATLHQSTALLRRLLSVSEVKK